MTANPTESASAAANEKPMTTIEKMARSMRAANCATYLRGSVADEMAALPILPVEIAMARAALQVLREPGEGAIEAMDGALAAWRKTLDRDEAMMRSYQAHDRKFIASATPAEKHAIRFAAAIDHIIGETER